MTNLDDTQPNPVIYGQDEIPAPPRILLWGVILLMVLGIVGVISGVYIFREVLPPFQQQRVINRLPFMEALLVEGPPLPTAPPVDQQALESLLNSPLSVSPPAPGGSTITDDDVMTQEATSIPEMTDEVISEATEETNVDDAQVVAVVPTETLDVPTATAQPTNTPLPTPIPTEIAQIQQQNASNTTSTNTSIALPTSHINGGIRWEQQTWNNCGPANITMALSYYGWTRSIDYAEDILKPELEDKNVSPHEMVSFVNEQSDLRAIQRFGGDVDMLRTLIANEFPVIIETGYNPEGNDWLGHYQTVAGYDDTQQVFFVYDSFIGVNTPDGIIVETYNELDENWQDFNHIFIVIYEPSREDLVMDLIGIRADPMDAAEHAFSVAQEEAQANPQDPFNLFNMGVSLSELGRYDEAAIAFDRANQLGFPYRMLWYQFNLFETFFNVGRLDDVMAYVNANLNNGGQWVEETYYWQGRVYEAQGNIANATTAYRTALRRNRNFEAAQIALDNLS